MSDFRSDPLSVPAPRLQCFGCWSSDCKGGCADSEPDALPPVPTLPTKTLPPEQQPLLMPHGFPRNVAVEKMLAEDFVCDHKLDYDRSRAIIEIVAGNLGVAQVYLDRAVKRAHR